MPKPIPPHKRDAILTDIRTTDKPCRQIAHDHGVSRTTVSDLAKKAGITDAFGRQQTEKATKAREIDHKAKLAELAAQAARIAANIGDSLEAIPPEGWADVSPYTRGLVFGITSDKAKDLTPDDTSHDQVASLFGALLSGLQAKHGDGDDSAAE